VTFVESVLTKGPGSGFVAYRKNSRLAKVAVKVEKNANFFAENWRKSQKILIITATPGPARSRRSLQTVENGALIFRSLFLDLYF
jgi:hypothetical protein